jgi:site-specific recombinase XerD
MEPVGLLDAAGDRRGCPPRNKGLRYPADPPSVEEIVAVMRQAGDGIFGVRVRGLIVVLWRGGLRISEGLALAESDLDAARGSILVRRGQGRSTPGDRHGPMGWEQLRPWLDHRLELPVGPLFASLPVRRTAARGQPQPHERSCACLAARAGVRRRFAPHQLRHAHAVEMAREGVLLNVIQRQLGHANLGITSVYLQGIDSHEIIDIVYSRRAPMLPASAGLRQ